MVNVLTPLFTRPAWRRRLMMNKSLRGRGRESSRNRIYGFQRGHGSGETADAKKRAAVSGGF